jgi:hypothetical protein
VPRVATIEAVLLLGTVRAPVLARVDFAHHTALVLTRIFPLRGIDPVFLAEVLQEVTEVCTPAVTQAVRIISGSAVGNTAGRFGVGVAEGVGLEGELGRK